MFFSIIKIILIVLGCILGFFLLLLMYFLFTPIRFKTDVDFDRMHINISLGDVLRLYRFKFVMEDDYEISFKVLFGLLDLAKEKKPKEKTDTKRVEKNGDEGPINSESQDSADDSNTLTTTDQKEGSKKKEKKNTSGRTQDIKQIWREIRDKRNIRALKFALKKVLFLIKNLFFRKIIADVDFGFADPATTGYVTGALATMPVMYDENINIRPDFITDENYIHGNARIQGRLFPIKLITTLFGIYNNRDVRRAIGRFRELSKG